MLERRKAGKSPFEAVGQPSPSAVREDGAQLRDPRAGTSCIVWVALQIVSLADLWVKKDRYGDLCVCLSICLTVCLGFGLILMDFMQASHCVAWVGWP